MCDRAFGRWLAGQLGRREWTQADFARRVGASTGTVSRWINGGRVPDPESVDRIADVLGLDVAFVMERVGHLPTIDPTDPDDPREILARKIRRLDLRQTEPWQLEALEAMVDAWLDKQRSARPPRRP